MSALARLCTLSHFDLDLLSGGEVLRSYTETSRCYLLDSGAFVLVRACCDYSFEVFTALTAVRLAADAVHGDSHTFVCFLRDRTVGHCARLEAVHNACCAFNLIKQDSAVLGEVEVKSASEREVLVLSVESLGILFIKLVIARPSGLLEKMYRERIVKVFFLAAA